MTTTSNTQHTHTSGPLSRLGGMLKRQWQEQELLQRRILEMNRVRPDADARR